MVGMGGDYRPARESNVLVKPVRVAMIPDDKTSPPIINAAERQG